MKRILKYWIRSGALLCMLLLGTAAFSQTDDQASAKGRAKDKMPVIVPESNDSIPVIDRMSKDRMPTINPDTAGIPAPKSPVIRKKKRAYKNRYEYPSYGNHFRDNRIGTMVGQSDTRRKQKKQVAPQ
ncbi:MAG: hypothetical protein ACJ75J_02865 [Cytophagaceae bacterium]